MEKKKGIIIAVVALVVVAAIILVIALVSRDKSSVKIDTVDDMKNMISDIYEETKIELMGLETREIELDDEFGLEAATGLKSNKNISNVVVSESMMGSIPYSLVMVKVKNSSDVEKVKKDMVDNIDMRKWICVNADILYATSYKDVIFVVYSTEENAKPQYEQFKNIVGKKIGKELKKEFKE